jgi:hypothetical protein
MKQMLRSLIHRQAPPESSFKSAPGWTAIGGSQAFPRISSASEYKTRAFLITNSYSNLGARSPLAQMSAFPYLSPDFYRVEVFFMPPPRSVWFCGEAGFTGLSSEHYRASLRFLNTACQKKYIQNSVRFQKSAVG